jgi:hypothetical protein
MGFPRQSCGIWPAPAGRADYWLSRLLLSSTEVASFPEVDGETSRSVHGRGRQFVHSQKRISEVVDDENYDMEESGRRWTTEQLKEPREAAREAFGALENAGAAGPVFILAPRIPGAPGVLSGLAGGTRRRHELSCILVVGRRHAAL